MTEERTFLSLTLITGLLAGLVTVSFQYLINLITRLIGTNQSFNANSFLFGGILILVSGWITTRKYPSTAGSGVPGVKIALAVHHGNIPLKETIAKYITTVFSLSSGISLGKEGPVVAISSGIGSALGHFFNLSKAKIKALVAVGAAGGIAAAFNTPISAVVFTMEEVVGDLNAKILGSIIISSVVAAVTSEILWGEHIIASQLDYKLHNPLELIFYLLIGVAAAASGPVWMTITLKLRILFRKVLLNHRLTIICCSFIFVGLLSLIHPAVLGSGIGFLEETLVSELLDWKLLALIFVLKFLATAICYSAGPSGGLFMPTLMVGATLGSLIGNLGHTFFPELTTSSIGTYALVGMGAYFVTIIRAPLTSILIVFELTRDYNIILPVLIANVVAYMLTDKKGQGSIYEKISEQDGIHLPTRDDEEILASLRVDDAYVKDVESLDANLSIEEANTLIQKSLVSGFPVLANGRLHGIISKTDIINFYELNRLSEKLFDLCHTKVIKIYPDQSLMVAFDRLNRFQVSRLPVVSRLDDKKIIGIITSEDIINFFGSKLKLDKEVFATHI